MTTHLAERAAVPPTDVRGAAVLAHNHAPDVALDNAAASGLPHPHRHVRAPAHTLCRPAQGHLHVAGRTDAGAGAGEVHSLVFEVRLEERERTTF